MLTTKKTGADFIVFLRGRIDNHEGKSLEIDLIRFIEENNKCNLIISLKDVEYLSSSGIRIFLSTQRLLKENGFQLKLCELQPAVTKLLQAAKIIDYLDISETLEDAINSL